MKGRIGRAMLAMLAMIAVPAEAQKAPLAPTGKWTLDYGDIGCTASHAYGTEADGIVFGIRPNTFATTVQLVLIEPSHGSVSELGRGAIEFGPTGTKHEFQYVSYMDPATKRRVTSMYADRASTLAAMATATGAKITFMRGKAVAFELRVPPAIFKQFELCEASLQQSWGFDPAALASIKTPAVPTTDPVTWLTSDDYPPSAIREDLGGSTLMRWTIGVDGVVSDCTIMQTSGTTTLDQAACQGIMRRGGYTPALDGAGQPVKTAMARWVHWRMPR